MTDVVARILRERERRPGQRENESRGQFFWRVLRDSIRDTTKLVSKADTINLLIGHGVHHLRKINHIEQIKDVVFNPLTEEYVTIDSQGINVFHKDGTAKEQIEPEEPIDRLLYCRVAKRYVGWTPTENYLKMFAEDYELISEAKSPYPITCVRYNEQQNEIVSAGPSHIMSWCFRYAAKHLIPQKVVRSSVFTHDTFTMLAVENTASRAQRCFAVCESNIAVFNLHEGILLEYKRNLHVRKITSVLFFNPLKYLITGARDGAIKVWDDVWHLKLVFVGHRGPVTTLSIYPYGPYIVSGSEDCTLRVWSLETCDEVDLIETGLPVEGLGTVLRSDNIYSFADTTVDLWRLRHIHNLFTTVGSKVTKIQMTTHPDVPARAMCVCRDGTVRIVTPGSGDVLTSFLAEVAQQGIVDAAYAGADDALFVILKSGKIIKADTTTNPCRAVSTWTPLKGSNDKNTLNCICLYEYVVQSTVRNDTWKGILKTTTNAPQPGCQLKSADRMLLIGGRKDGYVAVLDWKTMKVVFKSDAHGFKGVLGVATNPKHDQLITAGLDNVIKVWRVFPFAEEALTPLMSIYCAHMPLHMSVMKTTLCVAFQDPNTATYSLVHYNLVNKSRNDHSPDEDHIDNITGLACNSRMKVFASSSLDGTIKIWDNFNRLIKCIKLNAEPYGLDFCSQRGDLLVGIGNHIHRISHDSFMPRAYLHKMVSMVFPAVPTEEPLEYEPDGVRALSPLSYKRLKAAHSSLFKFEHFVDVLTEEETEEITREKKEKEKAYVLLAAREEELRKLRDGQCKFSKVNAIRKGTSAAARVKHAAFHSYWDKMHLETDRPDISEYDDFDLDQEEVDLDPEKPWIREREPVGFFPDPKLACKPLRKHRHLEPINVDKVNKDVGTDGDCMLELGEQEQKVHTAEEGVDVAGTEEKEAETEEEEVEVVEMDEVEEDYKLPILATGFIPNSVLVRLIWPPEETAKVAAERYKPPEITDEQLAQIEMHKKGHTLLERIYRSKTALKYRSRLGKGRVEHSDKFDEFWQMFAWNAQDVEKKQSLEELEFETPSPSKLAKKLGINIERPSPAKDIEDDKALTLTPPPPSEAPKDEARKPAKVGTTMKVEKFVPRPKPPPPKEKTPTPPPPPTPSPPRPPTPLPQFIVQFKGSDWFEQYFPNATNRTFPKPWTVTAFVTMLLRLIKIAEYGMKTPIMYAIITLHQQHALANAETVLDLIFALLNKNNVPTFQNEDQREFIVAALYAVKAIGTFNKKTVVQIMVEFVDGDKVVRELAHDMFLHMGLEDVHNYFFKELDSWDVWNMEEDSRKKEIKEIAQMWLDQWMNLFKGHLKRTIEQLQKGKLSGKIARKRSMASSAQSSSSSKSIQKPGEQPASDPPSSSQDSDKQSETSTVESPTKTRPKLLRTVSLGPQQQKSLTVTFNVPPDISALDNIQPIEAINYFVEMEIERHLERLKMAAVRKQQNKEDDKKNTVLVLPKIRSKASLVRLGETHTSTCKDRRETILQTELRLPPLPHQLRKKMEADGLYSFTTKIDFPVKTFILNPFPSPIDIYDQLHQPILLTLKSSQKYFVPDQSVVQSENYS